MLTLLTVLIVCNLIQLGLTLVLLFILWAHLPVWESIRHSLRMFDHPDHLAKPLPDPGSSWVASDRELAYREAQMIHASEGRVDSMGRPARPFPTGSSRLPRRSTPKAG